MDALYISPMEYGENAAVDALSHAMDHTLRNAGVKLHVAYADFRKSDWLQRTRELIQAGVAADVQCILLYSIDPLEPAAEVAMARRCGVRVVCLERPRFEVDACVVLPNFNHGLYMMEHLATLVAPGARVGVIGGPGTADDQELLAGILYGLATYGLTVVNDPHAPRYRNDSDIRDGGREKAAHLLNDFVDLDAIVPYNDESALGAVDVLRETGRVGSLKIVSRNGSPSVVALVASGLHDGTWDHDVLGVGRTMGEVAVRSLTASEPFDALCVASPIGRIITPERARTWVPWQDRIGWRPLRRWDVT